MERFGFKKFFVVKYILFILSELAQFKKRNKYLFFFVCGCVIFFFFFFVGVVRDGEAARKLKKLDPQPSSFDLEAWTSPE